MERQAWIVDIQEMDMASKAGLLGNIKATNTSILPYDQFGPQSDVLTASLFWPVTVSLSVTCMVAPWRRTFGVEVGRWSCAEAYHWLILTTTLGRRAQTSSSLIKETIIGSLHFKLYITASRLQTLSPCWTFGCPHQPTRQPQSVLPTSAMELSYVSYSLYR